MAGPEKGHDRWDPGHLPSTVVIYSNLQLTNIFKKRWRTQLLIKKFRNRFLMHLSNSSQCWAKLLGRLWPCSTTGHDSRGNSDWTMKITTTYTVSPQRQHRKGDNTPSNKKGKRELSYMLKWTKIFMLALADHNLNNRHHSGMMPFLFRSFNVYCKLRRIIYS